MMLMLFVSSLVNWCLCLGSHHAPGSDDREQQHFAGASLGSHQQHHSAGHWPGAALTNRPCLQYSTLAPWLMKRPAGACTVIQNTSTYYMMHTYFHASWAACTCCVVQWLMPSDPCTLDNVCTQVNSLHFPRIPRDPSGLLDRPEVHAGTSDRSSGAALPVS